MTTINESHYQGDLIPNIKYKPESLITHWEVIGPYNKPNSVIERNHSTNNSSPEDSPGLTWNRFTTDARGCIITGSVTEYNGENTVAYFRTSLNAHRDTVATLHFTTTDELALFLNGRDVGRVYRDGYVSKTNDWNAWYDFWENPEHEGRKVRIPLAKGENELIIRVRNGQFASGGFFVYRDK